MASSFAARTRAPLLLVVLLSGCCAVEPKRTILALQLSSGFEMSEFVPDLGDEIERCGELRDALKTGELRDLEIERGEDYENGHRLSTGRGTNSVGSASLRLKIVGGGPAVNGARVSLFVKRATDSAKTPRAFGRAVVDVDGCCTLNDDDPSFLEGVELALVEYESGLTVCVSNVTVEDHEVVVRLPGLQPHVLTVDVAKVDALPPRVRFGWSLHDEFLHKSFAFAWHAFDVVCGEPFSIPIFAHGETRIGVIDGFGEDEAAREMRWTAIVSGDCDVDAPRMPGVLSVFRVREPTQVVLRAAAQ